MKVMAMLMKMTIIKITMMVNKKTIQLWLQIAIPHQSQRVSKNSSDRGLKGSWQLHSFEETVAPGWIQTGTINLKSWEIQLTQTKKYVLHHQRNTFKETVAAVWIQTGTINPPLAQKLPPRASHLSPPLSPPSSKTSSDSFWNQIFAMNFSSQTDWHWVHYS